MLRYNERLGNARLKELDAAFRNLASDCRLFGWVDAKRSHRYKKTPS